MISFQHTPIGVNGKLVVEAVALVNGAEKFRRELDLESPAERESYARDLVREVGRDDLLKDVLIDLEGDAKRIRAEADARPQYKTVGELRRQYPKLREAVIHGLLRDGESMNVIAPSKFGKSWLVIDLALSIATGRPWLGTFDTVQEEVLILDNELHPETTAFRIPHVAAARGIPPEEYEGRICVDNLRGRLKDIFGLAAYFNAVPKGKFKVIILDAFYRFIPKDTDENDNGAMANIYNFLDSYASKLGCCFVLIHHSSKGSQGLKSVTDVGAGAGAQARATDTHAVLRQHEEDGVVVLDAAVRSWAPINPMCLRWQFPIFNPEPELDPSTLRTDGRRKKRKEDETSEPKVIWTTQLFVQHFLSAEPRNEDQITVDAQVRHNMSARAVKRFLSAAEAERKVFRWITKNPSNSVRYSTQQQPVLATGEGSPTTADGCAPEQPQKPARKRAKKKGR